MKMMMSRFSRGGGQPIYMSSMGASRKQSRPNMRHAKSAHVK